MSVRGRKRVPRALHAFLACRQPAIQRCGCVRTGVRCRVGTFRLQGIPASYLIFLEKIGSAKRFTPNSRGSEKECFAFSGGYPADAGCRRAGEIRLVKSTSWRIAGEIVSFGDCIRKTLNGDPQWWLFRFGSLRRHRNSEKAGTFAAFSLALRS